MRMCSLGVTLSLSPFQIRKLTEDVKSRGLGLVVVADWYSTAMMSHVRFYDDNTQSW